jgi:hypothetical protein
MVKARARYFKYRDNTHALARRLEPEEMSRLPDTAVEKQSGPHIQNTRTLPQPGNILLLQTGQTAHTSGRVAMLHALTS